MFRNLASHKFARGAHLLHLDQRCDSWCLLGCKLYKSLGSSVFYLPMPSANFVSLLTNRQLVRYALKWLALPSSSPCYLCPGCPSFSPQPVRLPRSLTPPPFKDHQVLTKKSQSQKSSPLNFVTQIHITNTFMSRSLLAWLIFAQVLVCARFGASNGAARRAS